MEWLKRLFATTTTPQAALDKALAALKQVLGPDLISMVAYGSYVNGEFVAGSSDLNVLVICRRLDSDVTGRLAGITAALSRPLKPLFFGQGELKSAIEFFPLEFQDIAETRKVIFGEDPFRGEVPLGGLLAQLERETRDQLVVFRQKRLRAGKDLLAQRALVSSTIGALFPILRGFLRLKRRKPPRERVRVIEEACRMYRLGRRTLLQAHDLRYHRKNQDRIDVPRLLHDLQQELDRLVQMSFERGGDEGAEPSGPRESSGRGGDGHRGRFKSGGGADNSKRLTEVRQLMSETEKRKRWEPKEPERFVSDDAARDTSLSPGARFAWDREWQPERRGKGYVPKAAPEQEPEPEQGPDLEDEPSLAAVAAVSPEQAAPSPAEEPESI